MLQNILELKSLLGELCWVDPGLRPFSGQGSPEDNRARKKMTLKYKEHGYMDEKRLSRDDKTERMSQTVGRMRKVELERAQNLSLSYTKNY